MVRTQDPGHLEGHERNGGLGHGVVEDGLLQGKEGWMETRIARKGRPPEEPSQGEVRKQKSERLEGEVEAALPQPGGVTASEQVYEQEGEGGSGMWAPSLYSFVSGVSWLARAATCR